MKQPADDDEEIVNEIPVIDTSIDQDPFWSMVVDINAVVAMALVGLAIAFLNKY